ncbi:ubiquitin carboxyl-terminal hydrolase 3-like isoform X2 [Schistocerca nitens]|uniref:ubiquitin carboxyl-terminal hydrolase 3-like isoform X2 n=1 Tax=Schistocerca nitens TaxID=7011 RepID=UPI002119224F|nr:ubiquitin carboxyl-terminal hydrolase 3-like isoform X2 [Schistocerca nitens]
MECPHLLSSVKFHVSAYESSSDGIRDWQCAVCSSSESPWLCLYCGTINCGRYINGHAKHHSEQHSDHTLSMDCETLAVFCYTCDEFITNDTQSDVLQGIRRLFHKLDAKTNEENECRTAENERKPWKSRSLTPRDSQENVRILRPRSRKRYSTSDVNGEVKYKKQHIEKVDKPKNNNAKLRREKKVVGIRNLGNTCFMNAVLQSLRGYQQQDAHEFLRYMLDRLHTELLHLLPDFSLKESPYISLQKGRTSIVTSVFGGTLQSEVRCLNCSTESKKHDPFLDLSLDIPDKFQLSRKYKDHEGGIPPCNISDCLKSFIEVEELAETELYYCSTCKSKQRSTKRFWIHRLPNVLCLHLKRFRWHNFFRTKIDTNISFPVTALDMSQYVLSNLHDTRRSGSGSNLYDLAAVIVHHGSGAGSGHYTAFAVNDGQWFHFNDSTVRPTECGVVAKCKPYILFYIRREFRLPTVST